MDRVFFISFDGTKKRIFKKRVVKRGNKKGEQFLKSRVPKPHFCQKVMFLCFKPSKNVV